MCSSTERDDEVIGGPDSENAAIVLLLSTIVVKELIGLVKWALDRKKADDPAYSWKANAQQHTAVLAGLREVKRQLTNVEDTHSHQGMHHRAVELANRRLAALLRNLKVDDPG